MILLIYFISLSIFLFAKNNRSIALVFVLIHVLSLSGTMLIDGGYPVDTLFEGYNLIVTAIVLTLIILPWMRTSNILIITTPNERKIKRLTYLLLLISILPFITFIIVTAFVVININDINAFKYAEGISTGFYYNLPVNVKLIILSNHIYYVSYFLIPLHFYYLSKRNIKLSIACFVFSLNIVLYGFTYFSRAFVVQYVLIYLSFLYILHKTLDIQLRRYVKLSVVTLGILFVAYFAHITSVRFTSDKIYAENIPHKAFIQHPVIYSYFDYLSQWYYNGMYVLNSYDYKTLKGQISLQPALSLLDHFELLDYDTSAYMKLRKKMWPLNWDSFNGLVAYSVYDYGYFLTTILSLCYCYLVIKIAPINQSISVINLLVMVLIIQLPLMAIFYSNVGGVLFPFFFLIPIYTFLRIKWT